MPNRSMIFIKPRDPRFITTRRGGSLTDENHKLLALWAATCAQHVLPYFEKEMPHDNRPRKALEQIRAWTQDKIKMSEARAAGGHAMAAARSLTGAARFAAYSAGQAAVVAHVAAHELGAAAYAIKAVQEASTKENRIKAGQEECRWQRNQLPLPIRELVIDDERIRNHVCWGVFELKI